MSFLSDEVKAAKKNGGGREVRYDSSERSYRSNEYLPRAGYMAVSDPIPINPTYYHSNRGWAIANPSFEQVHVIAPTQPLQRVYAVVEDPSGWVYDAFGNIQWHDGRVQTRIISQSNNSHTESSRISQGIADGRYTRNPIDGVVRDRNGGFIAPKSK